MIYDLNGRTAQIKAVYHVAEANGMGGGQGPAALAAAPQAIFLMALQKPIDGLAQLQLFIHPVLFHAALAQQLVVDAQYENVNTGLFFYC